MTIQIGIELYVCVVLFVILQILFTQIARFTDDTSFQYRSRCKGHIMRAFMKPGFSTTASDILYPLNLHSSSSFGAKNIRRSTNRKFSGGKTQLSASHISIREFPGVSVNRTPSTRQKNFHTTSVSHCRAIYTNM